MTPVA